MPENNEYNRTAAFATQAEANAFAEGVRFANDNTIHVVGTTKTTSGVTVRLMDDDHGPPEAITF